MKISLGLVLSWLLGGILLLASLGSFMSSGSIGLCYLLMSLILLPPVRKFTYGKTNISISTGLRVTILIVLFFSPVYIQMNNYKEEKSVNEIIAIEPKSPVAESQPITEPVQSIATYKTEDNIICQIEASTAEHDLKEKYRNKYPDSYSTQRMLLKSGMKAYHSLCALGKLSEVEESVLKKKMNRYYPSFSTIKMLYDKNMEDYRALNN